jgi:hypothetical protein
LIGRVGMIPKRILATCTIIGLVVSGVAADGKSDKGTLSALYERIFRGSRAVGVPKDLTRLETTPKKLFQIELKGPYPFRYRTHLRSYLFPVLTNDDDGYFYFQSPITLSNDDERTGGSKAFSYKKQSGHIEVAAVDDPKRFLREKLRDYYMRATDSSDGALRIDIENNAAYIVSSGDGYEIINPKDIDAGASEVFMAVMNPTESNIPYRQSSRDIELLVYDRNSHAILRDLTLPFSGMYIPIGTQERAIQSVASQRYVYVVLNSSVEGFPTIDIPRNGSRWHILVYDASRDALCSVWHGMDETDGLKALSFSYYLGREGLFFEVLKDGKIEIYLIEIDPSKAKPLSEYETVDLLWNNKGLKALWEKKVEEQKKKDPSFEAVWR